MNYLIEQAWIQALGWTLLHACWQACLIAAIWGISRNFLRKSSPHQRYLIAISALFSLLLCSAITYWKVYPESLSDSSAAVSLESIGISWESLSLSNLDFVVDKGGWNWQQFLDDIAPWLSVIWILGAALMVIRFSTGLLYLKKLRSKGLYALDSQWQSRVDQLAQKMGLGGLVAVWESELVTEPLTLGHFKPLVLIPMGMLSGLTPDQVEAILAHEFAHIYRADFLFNLIQSLIEILFFFHPAVWWLSREIRRERELCCDDLAVAASGDALTYAEALTRLQLYRHSPQTFLTMQAKGNSGSFTARIHRLFIPQKSRPSAWKSLSAALLLTIGIMGTGYYAYTQSFEGLVAQRKNKSELPIYTNETSSHEQNLSYVYLDGKALGYYEGSTVLGPLMKEGKIKAFEDIGKTTMYVIEQGNFKDFLTNESFEKPPLRKSEKSYPSTFAVQVLETWEYLAEKFDKEGNEKHRMYFFDGGAMGFQPGNIKEVILQLCESKRVDSRSISVSKLSPEEASSKYKVRAVEVIEISSQAIAKVPKTIDTKKGKLHLLGEIYELGSKGTTKFTGGPISKKENYYFFDGKPLGYRTGEVMGVIKSEIDARNLETIGGIVIADAKNLKDPAAKVVQILSEEYESSYYKRLKTKGKETLKLNGQQGQPLIHIDGEEVPYEALQQLDPTAIKTINVSKGDDALKLGGLTAENGLIQIVTKEGTSNADQKVELKFEGKKPLVFIDEQEVPYEELEKLDKKSIATINVLKGESANKLAGDRGENGIIKVTTKAASVKGQAAELKFEGKNPLVFIDEQEVPYEEMEKLDPKDIATMDVLKGEAAEKLAGDRGEHGIIKITTKAEKVSPKINPKVKVETEVNIKTAIELNLQVSPNPSPGTFNINFELDQQMEIQLKILDLQGKIIHNPMPMNYAAGPQKILWEAGKEADGIYIVQIETEDGKVASKRVVLEK